ncbi:mechanosensitive ion channel protein MscS [Aliidiomarina iranensis]|uniref:Mechanosensitive ion channel protein MscS n=1 Tax=Aliidiomarina iranensis TaxID=1434071 RepID=A0A432VRQ5_9GAMM|nr:mechanosensitive ion channel domain-containing protein [Aliidiomarina iranensis]RUO19000.1 mechanosensitive ion channel protein MscS [Aliidiomarina iranensis]
MELIFEQIQVFLNQQTISEWVVLLLSILAALISRRVLLQKLGERGNNSRGLRLFAIRSLERILWPASMLVVLWLGQLVVNTYQYETLLLDLVVPLVLSFAAIRFIVYFLRKSLRGGAFLKASENFIAATIWLVVGLHLTDLLPQAMAALDSVGTTIGSFRLSLLSGLKLSILILLALTIAGWLSHLVEVRLTENKSINASARVGLIKFVKFAAITIALLIVLSSVGVDLSTFAVFGGALGVGLGFGLQRIAANFISGFIVIMDRSVKPGDVVTIGTEFGWVQELKSRYIVLRNRAGVDTLIPNENLITSNVINWSYADRNVRMAVQVDIEYSCDPEKAIEVMLPCAFASDRVLRDPAPNVFLKEFGPSGITMELRFWISDPESGVERVKSPIRVAIWKAFQEHGLTIPFPQRDLHLKSVDFRALQQLQEKLAEENNAIEKNMAERK